MEDTEIVSLYWNRNEDAIKETSQKYGAYLLKLAMNILYDYQDSEECVNDTYLRTWNSIPMKKPTYLSCFLAKITRCLAVDQYRKKHAQKRYASEYAVSLSELGDIFEAGSTPEQELHKEALHDAIDIFLRRLSPTARNVFMGRYFFFDSTKKIATYMLLEELDSISSVMGDLSISQEDAIALLQNLPDDLDATRKAVIEHALSLVGKVNYFWGGKSLVLGWDPRWGTTMQVTAEGSFTTGTYRPFGLDCSGFVDWVFYNATDGTYLVGNGGGTVMQHNNCREISWSEALPGDLAFYADDSHVGIIGGTDDYGKTLVIHCSGGHNNVVITGIQEFGPAARPFCFEQN